MHAVSWPHNKMELPLSWMMMKVFPLIFIFLWYIMMSSCAVEAATNETDRVALLAFKSQINKDPLRIMHSWNDSLHFCDWPGVTCGRRHRRVVDLNLQSHSLEGSISPYIGNLSFLRSINLQENAFQGEIPQEIGHLFRLKVLNLTTNSFVGKIPTSLSNCSNLKAINLGKNYLLGEIPVQFGSLSKLIGLIIFSNNLTGGIPPSLGNISSLELLSLGQNSLGGSIPDSLHQLTSLIFVDIDENQLSGMVPPWLFNISSLMKIYMVLNQLVGSLPPDISVGLPNLQILSIGSNNLTGPIPPSLSNASQLQYLDLSGNNFIGSVPINFGGLRHLSRLNLGSNSLGHGKADDLYFFTSLTNCSNLEVLALDHNKFGGMLPDSVANLSTKLQLLALGSNQIVGSIPLGIGNLVNLSTLSLSINFFTSSIPNSVGKLQKLQRLHLHGNRLSGQIPSSIGNLTLLYKLFLDQNNLTGNIPWSLENCRKLQFLTLYQNNLNGSIPKPPSFLIILDLYHNSLIGSIPVEVGNLKNLGILDISENKLSGEIPTSLGDCLSLEQLYMEGNFFHGNIPSSFASLRGVQYLDLSRNNLSGKIPRELQNLPGLLGLNLSLNHLEGEVPSKGIFKNASAISIFGNNNLCGGISKLQLLVCPSQESKKHRNSHSFKEIFLVVGVVISLISIMSCTLILHARRKSRKKLSSTFSIVDQHVRVSYGEIVKATDGFSAANLIGSGSYGSVYKGVLHQYETVVAIKVLNLQQRGASKSFMSECKALRNIRHRNLLKTLSSCSSVDFQGNDFKAHVLEFMPNGSLESWLHPGVDEQEHGMRNLSFIQRLNIAIDVASALDYLHHRCPTTIVHLDLKPSNVLLDVDMIAHVSDFGLAKVLSISSDYFIQSQTNSIAIKGSVGYIPPEYGMGVEPSIFGDVYSFGMLLLEMFTAKRPTNDMFKDDLSLHNFVKMALPERAMQIMDARLFLEDENVVIPTTLEHQNDRNHRMWKCLVSVLKIGVTCSMEAPRERMEMNNVVVELCLISDAYQGLEINGRETN